MTRRVLPVGLVVAAAAAGVQGHPRLAFYVLVAAVPAAAAAALALYGELLDAGDRGPVGVLGVELALAVGGLLLLLAAATTRESVAGGDPIPAVSSSALGACVAVLVAQALVAFLPQPPERSVSGGPDDRAASQLFNASRGAR